MAASQRARHVDGRRQLVHLFAPNALAARCVAPAGAMSVVSSRTTSILDGFEAFAANPNRT
ncbi:MAG: hypothetical protein DMF58_05625 [Acidobacteria bacterium]|nr:MAG: hypothetical protein DMF58_05625 [Acidobacteriota bacterium]